jgi:hypothetical protein
MELVLPTYIPLFEPPTKSQEAESLENLLLRIRLFKLNVEQNEQLKRPRETEKQTEKTRKRKRSGRNKNKKNRICGIKKPKR